EPAPDEHETRLLHKNGSTLTVMVRARLSEWDGRPASLAIITDITALRELQRERERFFRFMVHELRAPLSPLVTAVSLFRNPEVLADKTRLEGLLRLVTRSVNRLQTFVDDFLELSKLDQETLVVTQEELDLQQIVEEVLDGQRLLAEDKGLEIVVEPWQKFRILGDAFAVRTVIQNLINNAIKYTDKGRVTVSASQKDGRFAIRVADTGSGLTPDEQATLFQEFGRIQRTAGVKGSGLGLALVKKLVDACGGSVTAHSEGRNQGSVFTVELPCVFGKPQNGASHKEAN
ncbi:MAG TPA: PAS domain-containing sensor histidine kinase, partial [Candidatus Brocadiia bacterium]|nr:PAS domain-containing sensor histidine kinase [Candidatus Brocadiia bacterium]